MDIVEFPDGTIVYYPQGVEVTTFSTEKHFPLGSKLTKANGKRYFYYKQVKSRKRKVKW